MKRDIIVIDEDLCNGCGLCVPNCHEGALQIIDNKARLISDLFCDGLGACIGHCPEGAMKIEKREAEPYDEVKVMKLMVDKGENTILAHLNHLKDHGETEFLKQATDYLKEINFDMDLSSFEENTKSEKEIIEEVFGAKHTDVPHSGFAGCPGSRPMEFNIDQNQVNAAAQTKEFEVKSELKQWPVQLHLLNPQAQYFRNADVVLAADCVAFSMGDFHRKHLKGNDPSTNDQQNSHQRGRPRRSSSRHRQGEPAGRVSHRKRRP